MNKKPNNLPSKSHAGFSLVDLMVGMVIALLGIIIIFQVFSVSERIKRTTTSGGDAQQNGATAMFSLQNSFLNAGYGLLYCTPTVTNCDNPVPVAFTITPGGLNSDTITLQYRQNWDFGSYPASGAATTTINYPPLPGITTETITVQTNCNGNGSVLLQLCSSVRGVLSDGIVLMKAEYGIDTTSSGAVSAWTQTAPALPLTMLNVLAVRFVLVARSAQPEVTRDPISQKILPCQTTTAANAPNWIDGVTYPLSLVGQADLAVGDNWQCYRYKTFENTVTLRDVIWR